MNKLSIIAGAVLLTAGIAAASPSFAANIASCTDDVTHNDVHNGGSDQSAIDTNSTSILQSLRAKGINVQDVSDWGGCVKADVVRANGHVAQEFFDPGTLQRLHVNRG
jgi:hypothetical protein